MRRSINVRRRKTLSATRSTNVEVECTNQATHLRIALTGSWTPANSKYSVVQVRQLAIQHGVNRVLLDMTHVLPPESAYARFETGVQTAELFGYPFRIAVFGQPALINHFAGNVAANRGARLRVFTNETQAMHWLLAGKAISAEEMHELFPVPQEVPNTPLAS